MGTPYQQRFAELAVERKWTATMALTEPDAGSDVGAGRARAVRQPDGSGISRGSSGSSPVPSTTWPRTSSTSSSPGPRARPGTKGLSMFLVPSTCRRGRRTRRAQRRLRHRGRAQDGPEGVDYLRADLRRVPPRGRTLVGDVHDGIRQMFVHHRARPDDVGTKAIGDAVDRLPERAGLRQDQGSERRLTRMADKTAPRVAIIAHPDVRRMLMLQKAYAEGMRAAGALYGDLAGRPSRPP